MTGDSLGHVQLWDGRFGTLLQSFATHTADVMCIRAVPVSGPLAFVSCSLDGKVALHTSVNDSAKKVRWICCCGLLLWFAAVVC